MKKLIAIFLSILVSTSIVLAYTTTVKVKGFGVITTSEPGNEVTVVPKIDIDGWKVNSGGVTVNNNKFTMPKADVDIEAIINGPTLAAGVNSPVLVASEMVPVKWDASIVNTDGTTDEANWDYNYDTASTWSTSVGSDSYGVEGDGTAKWANVMLRDGLSYYNSGSTGDTTTVASGDTVPAGKVIATQGSSYVWIPRFTYHTENGNNISWNSDVEGEKTARTYILFSDGTEDFTTDPSGETAYTYNKHSAFTLTDASSNTTEITGFWIAKYETSKGTNNLPKSTPNVSPWVSETVSDMYTYAKDLNNTNTTIGAHMLKDSEWGATALLTSAKGRIPYINNNTETGYAGNIQDASTSDTKNLWKTENGVRGSTTHNVYGIYDMNGGVYEYVAAYYSQGTTSRYENLKTTYNTYGTKYVDLYSSTSPTGDNARTSWDSDYGSSLSDSVPVVLRGGFYNYTLNAGAFSFNNANGTIQSNAGFRVALFGISL